MMPVTCIIWVMQVGADLHHLGDARDLHHLGDAQLYSVTTQGDLLIRKS